MASKCAPRLGEVVSAFVKPKRAVRRVFLHCSATSAPRVDAEEVDRWHRERGWACIGYHYFIKSNGTLQAGRDLELTPAAQSGHNTYTLAICLNGLETRDFSLEQYAALRTLCREINTAYRGQVTFHGHCEVSAKTCPVFNYALVLGLDSEGRMVPDEGAQPVPGPLPPPQEAPNIVSLTVRRFTVSRERSPNHRDVMRLQGLLTAFSPLSPGPCDRDFGDKTEASLKAYQEEVGLIPDGVAGPVTWETIERG